MFLLVLLLFGERFLTAPLFLRFTERDEDLPTFLSLLDFFSEVRFFFLRVREVFFLANTLAVLPFLALVEEAFCDVLDFLVGLLPVFFDFFETFVLETFLTRSDDDLGITLL